MISFRFFITSIIIELVDSILKAELNERQPTLTINTSPIPEADSFLELDQNLLLHSEFSGRVQDNINLRLATKYIRPNCCWRRCVLQERLQERKECGRHLSYP